MSNLPETSSKKHNRLSSRALVIGLGAFLTACTSHVVNGNPAPQPSFNEAAYIAKITHGASAQPDPIHTLDYLAVAYCDASKEPSPPIASQEEHDVAQLFYSMHHAGTAASLPSVDYSGPTDVIGRPGLAHLASVLGCQ